MVLELLAAVLRVVIFVPLSRRLADGRPPKGRFWNFFEAMILFIRNEVVRPAMDKFRTMQWDWHDHPMPPKDSRWYPNAQMPPNPP